MLELSQKLALFQVGELLSFTQMYDIPSGRLTWTQQKRPHF